MIRISSTARQPSRVAWSLDELVHKRSIALGLALDLASQSTYSSALNSYLTFCALHNFPIEPNPDTLSFFIVYMCHHIEPRSVGTYLSGVVSQLEPHFPNVRAVRNGMLVARTLKGCKRLRSKPIRRKQPISRDHLRVAARSLSPRSTYDDILFVSMLFVGFYGLLRLGEMTMSDSRSLRNPRKYARRSSVEWIAEGFAFWLPTHKTDTTFEGSRVVIPQKSESLVDPVSIFRRYILARDSSFLFHPFLWVRENASVPTRSWFLRRLRKLIPNSGFAGQSIRSGGATALAEDGVSPHLIQATGRWSSDTFQIYIRKNPVILQAMLYTRRPDASASA